MLPGVMPLLALLTGIAVAPMAAAQSGPPAKVIDSTSGGSNAAPVGFNTDTRVCAEGLQQLVSPEQFEQLRAGWGPPWDGKRCTGNSIKTTPDSTVYPAAFAARKAAGAAYVLTQIDTNGTVAKAFAVCATDQAFAREAEDLARAIVFTPSVCAGKPVRSNVVIPLDYAFPKRN